MKTAGKVVPIEERLKSREFRDKLREHPIIKAKFERAKQALGIEQTAQEPAKGSD